MSIYFNKDNLKVSDGDDAVQGDINDFVDETDSAFEQVQQDIANVDQKTKAYAENDPGVPVVPGEYSAKHYSYLSKEWAIGTPVDDSLTPTGDQSAKDEALDAAASAVAAKASEDNAAASEASAGADAVQTAADVVTTGNNVVAAQAAQTGAESAEVMAEKWAEEAEDVEVEPGQYSALHWAKKAMDAASGVQTVTGTGVDNTDPLNPVITITKSTIGLGNVDNTSDVDKPVSTAQQSEIDTKEDLLGNPASNGQVLSSTTLGVRSWVDQPVGIPVGGSDGQVLTKVSATDYDIAWEDVNAGFQAPPTGSRLTGGITGLEYSNWTTNQIAVNIGAARDETNSEELRLTAVTYVTIPTVVDEVYNLFLVKQTSDDAITVKIDTDYLGGNLTDTAKKRWIGFTRTNSSGNPVQFTMSGDRIMYGTRSENLWLTNIAAAYTQYDHSDMMPWQRVKGIKYAPGHYTIIQWINCSQNGLTVEACIGKSDDQSPGDNDQHSWGNSGSLTCPWLPMLNTRYFSAQTGGVHEVYIHGVILDR